MGEYARNAICTIEFLIWPVLKQRGVGAIDRKLARMTNFAKISATSLPVSMIEETRLFAKTSGDTSVKICSVASRRRQRADQDYVLARALILHPEDADIPSLLGCTLPFSAISSTCSPLGPAALRISATFASIANPRADDTWN